jgi:GrpB-like predicted nucleotidyltransferase (UPF0157 family)
MSQTSEEWDCPTRTQALLQTKRELAGRDWKYVQQYADAKTDVIQEIMARASAP